LCQYTKAESVSTAYVSHVVSHRHILRKFMGTCSFLPCGAQRVNGYNRVIKSLKGRLMGAVASCVSDPIFIPSVTLGTWGADGVRRMLAQRVLDVARPRGQMSFFALISKYLG